MQALPGRRQSRARAGPLKQAHAERYLQRLYVSGDSGLANVQRLPRARETSFFRDHAEYRQTKTFQGSLHNSQARRLVTYNILECLTMRKLKIPTNLTSLAYKSIKEYILEGRLDE